MFVWFIAGCLCGGCFGFFLAAVLMAGEEDKNGK